MNDLAGFQNHLLRRVARRDGDSAEFRRESARADGQIILAEAGLQIEISAGIRSRLYGAHHVTFKADKHRRVRQRVSRFIVNPAGQFAAAA